MHDAGRSDQPSRWSDDAFLDQLRRQGDELADTAVASLAHEDCRHLFAQMDVNSAPLPRHVAAPLRGFFDATATLPSLDGVPIDFARLKRGEAVFCTHAFPAALVLIAASLPQGYAARNLAEILMISGDLKNHAYRRLLGVLQMVVDVTQAGGFEPSGAAVVSARKLRLLHAGVRRIARRQPRLRDYERTYGVPVNHEDMLATIMGFSLLVIEGFERLDMPLSPGEAEDFYYIWRVFAQLMGIHPAGRPDSTAYVPESVADARTFYDSYARRHFVDDPAKNPEGVALARANLAMMRDLLPKARVLRWLTGPAPRVYMQILNGEAGMRRVGITPVRAFPLARWLLLRLPRLWSAAWREADRVFDPSAHAHENMSRLFFQSLITRSYGRPVEFLVPERLRDMRKLA